MSSYFDYYCNNIENKGSVNSDQIRGTCYSMCPQDEIELRERERLVHVLEVDGCERRLVKSYSRSAADTNMAVPRHLRPCGVLRDTVHYLIFQVTKRSDVSIAVVYEFVNDRLRAVRQDMTIQRLPPAECAELLEPMIRFYVYYGYRLYGLPLKDYDPVLNRKYTLECIKWFLSSCDTLDSESRKTSSNRLDELCNVLDNLRVNGSNGQKFDRVLVECLYILCNLDDMYPLYRYIKLPKYLKMERRLQLAYKVAIANMLGNFVRVSKLLNSLCPLTYCAVCLYLPHMQRRALCVLSTAYSSARGTVPGEAAARWLAAGLEAPHVAAHYGLTVLHTGIRFHKNDFKHDAPMHTPNIQLLHQLHDRAPDLSMDRVFTYNT